MTTITRIIVDLGSDMDAEVRAALPKDHEVLRVHLESGDPEFCKSYEAVAVVEHGVERECWKQWVARIPGVTLTLAK